MSEEELYKLLNIPNKPWIELTDEETQLFEKNNNYIKQLQQENKQLKQQLKETNNCLNLQIANVTLLEKELKDKDEKISELNNLIDMSGKFTGILFDVGFKQNQKLEKIKSYLETTYTEWFNWKNDILAILESNKED